MEYELAKKLEDANFPYAGTGPYNTVYPKGVERPHYGRYQIVPEDDPGVRLPTLSELIEACGHAEVAGLRLHTSFTLDQVSPKDWRARTERTDFIHGTTPEEAVAKLWLALNHH